MWTSFPTYRGHVHPFEADTKGRLFTVDVSINWSRNRNEQAKVLDSWKVTQLILSRQENFK